MGMNGEIELPEGWISVYIPDICDINPKKPPIDSIPSDTPVTFVPMPAVDAELGAINTPETRKFGEVRKGFTFFQDNDVIFAKITPCMENGKAAIARNLVNGLGFGSTEFFTLRSSGAIVPEYLYYYIRQESFRKEAEENMTGSVGQERVPKYFIENTIIPLPPLAEQHRVVIAVEALLARLNALQGRLNRVPDLLKVFRQEVLAAASSGRLTEAWRVEHPNLEDVSEALNRCELETFSIEKSKKISKRGVKGFPDIDFPSNYPKKWALKKIKELYQIGVIIDYQDGNHGELYPRKTDFGTSGVRFLTATQVFDNKVLLEDAPLLKQEKASQLRIGFTKSHDVLLTHNATVGRVAVMPEVNEEIIIGTSLTYYRLNQKYIDSNFCSIIMQGPLWQNQLKNIMEQTTRNQVSITKQAEFYLEIAPLMEQHEIVRRFDSLFALADRIEQRVAIGKERADRLTQAILAKAFRGELVPTEAELARREGRSYEPANMLLERILASRDKTDKKKIHQ